MWVTLFLIGTFLQGADTIKPDLGGPRFSSGPTPGFAGPAFAPAMEAELHILYERIERLNHRITELNSRQNKMFCWGTAGFLSLVLAFFLLFRRVDRSIGKK